MGPRGFRVLLIALISALSVAPVFAAEDHQKPENAGDEKQATPAPISIEGTDLQRMLRRDYKPERLTKTAQGTRYDLAGGFRSVLVMRIGADGKPVTFCVTSEEAAKRALVGEAKVKVREP